KPLRGDDVIVLHRDEDRFVHLAARDKTFEQSRCEVVCNFALRAHDGNWSDRNLVGRRSHRRKITLFRHEIGLGPRARCDAARESRSKDACSNPDRAKKRTKLHPGAVTTSKAIRTTPGECPGLPSPADAHSRNPKALSVSGSVLPPA